MEHRNLGLYTDLYELTMAQGHFNEGRHVSTSSFDYFFRSNPFDGGFTIFAGLSDFLTQLENFTFSDDDCAYLKGQGFSDAFTDWLRDFSFSGSIHSVQEGEIVFPGEPILRVDANIVEAQLIETMLLNIINVESLITTKTNRIVQSAQGRKVVDFGLRRAQGWGGYHASKAAVIGGATATSNTLAGKDFDIPVSGTQAHSWIQSFDTELEAFQSYANSYPDQCILLVDTYDTLQSGIPNAIKVAKELEADGHRMIGIRLDSGDLAYLSKQARNMLDEAGLDYVNIAASNQLDEHLVKSLLDQEAPIDLFGVGTSLITGQPDAALDGVYKMSMFDDQPRLKVSENVEKITLPGRKKVLRYSHADGTFEADSIVHYTEEEPGGKRMIHPYQTEKTFSVSDLQKEEILQPVVEKGKIIGGRQLATQASAYREKRLQHLPDEYKRFENPHKYKVGISQKLKESQQNLIEQYKTQS